MSGGRGAAQQLRCRPRLPLHQRERHRRLHRRAPAKGAFLTLIDEELTFGADDIGRMLTIEGSANPVNDGEFLIIDGGDEKGLVFVNPAPGATPEKPTDAASFISIGSGRPA